MRKNLKAERGHPARSERASRPVTIGYSPGGTPVECGRDARSPIAIVSALREELAPLLRRAKIDRVVDRRFHVGTLSGTPVMPKHPGDLFRMAAWNLLG